MWSSNRNILGCQDSLTEWNKKYFGHVQNTLAKNLRELNRAKEEGCYVTDLGRIYKLWDEVQKLKSRKKAWGSSGPVMLGSRRVIVTLVTFIVG